MSYPPAIYHGEDGEVSARLVRGDGEPALVYRNGNKVFHLALGSGTGGTYGTGNAYETGVGAGAAGTTGGAHVAEPETTWGAEPTGVTGTEPPYTEPFPGEGTRRDDATGVL